MDGAALLAAPYREIPRCFLSQPSTPLGALFYTDTIGENQKGMAGRGRQKTSRQVVTNVTTISVIAYGQRDGFNLQALEKGMTPVVLEQYGRTAPGAQAIFNCIINHRLQLLVRQGIPFSFAERTASSELWGPISCTLLRAAWQAHAECTPRIGQADLGDTPPSLPTSPGKSQ